MRSVLGPVDVCAAERIVVQVDDEVPDDDEVKASDGDDGDFKKDKLIKEKKPKGAKAAKAEPKKPKATKK